MHFAKLGNCTCYNQKIAFQNRARITFHKNQSQAPASRCWRGLVHPAGLDKLRGVCYDFSSHNVFRCDVPPFSAGCGWPIAAASPTGNGSDGTA